MLLFLELLMILLGVLSFALWGEILRRKLVGLPVIPLSVRDPIHWSPMVVTFTFCWIAFQISAQFLESKDSPDPLRAVQLSCAMNVVILSLLLMVLTEIGQRRISEFGITLKNWTEETRYGVMGFLASLLPVFAVLIVSLLLSLRSEETQHSFLKMLRENPGPEIFFWITLAAVVLAPLTEELVFRVILQGALQSKFSPTTSIAISSIVFAGVHGFPDSLALVPLAVILGYVYHRRHSYLAVVVLHALFNLLNLMLSLL
ncbi:MAG: CPBP family intramembrane metalloprotease [Planctomycetes bacterium]|nr:CPBP family intramembrane metalloprotease [Planctomycetota bacterium]